jgi:DNA polymerase I
VRLTKTPEQYLATRSERRELSYEALLENGQPHWRLGERVRVYRAAGKRAGLLRDGDTEQATLAADPRDYDTSYYMALLRSTFAARLERALGAEDFAALSADPQQLTLFSPDLRVARPILTRLPDPQT